MPRPLKWDEKTIAATLGAVVADLGRMPTRTELERRDLSALWSAMRRHGGTRVWAARAGELAAAAEPVPGDLAAAAEPAAAEPVSAELVAAAEPVPPGLVVAAEPPATIEEQIRLRAYFLALDGAPGGPEEHWLQAERELAA
jgi:DUF2934 family protein